ncbi:cadherin domain-containing protein, partial [Caenimonas soli]|uniref:cadherin domain-containing protein n=1 Tax=Caenimonas soli TaxID=2735555 RepID=UPI001554D705
TGNPNHEAKSSYSFTVVATDGVGRTDSQAVTLAINDLDEADPTVTSGATATAIDENSGAGQVVYSATASDTDDVSAGVTFSLAGTDAAAFTIDAATGAVTLTGNPNHETKNSYSFTVVATDGVGRIDTQAVTLAVNDLDEADPTITSGTTATANDENSGAGQVIYTATATDTADISAGVTFSLAGTDAAAFTIDAATGAVTLTGNPNHEAKSSYSFTVIATDGAGRTDGQAVTLAINDLDEADPTVTSGATATAINENSGAGRVVYTATATDTDDISAGITFSLAGTDAAAFTIDSNTGAVKLAANPDYETKTSYTFSVVADDGVNAATLQAVTLAINDVDESVPTSSVPAPAPVPAPAVVPAVVPAIGKVPTFDAIGRRSDEAVSAVTAGGPAFSGNLFSLPITPFTLPDAQAPVFASLATEFSLDREPMLERSSHFLTKSYNDVLTLPGPGAFRIVVASGGEASLKVFRGIPDQDLSSTRSISVQVPVDAFVHSQEDAVIHLSARMVDGSALPHWLTFDASTGKFSGLVPADAPQELEILVEARDRDGRRSEAVFRIKVARGVVPGRAGLSEQIRNAAKPADSLAVLRYLPA